MVRECRPPAREPGRSWLARRSTMATSTPANANSPANISPVGPPPAITAAGSVIAGLAADPDVSLLDHEPDLIEAQERHADEVFGAAVGEPRLRAPRDGGSIAVDDRCAELTAGRLFFSEDAHEVAGLG